MLLRPFRLYDPEAGGGGAADPAKGQEEPAKAGADPAKGADQGKGDDKAAALEAKLKAAEEKLAARERADAEAAAKAAKDKAAAEQAEAVKRGEAEKVIAEKEKALADATARLTALEAAEKARMDRIATKATEAVGALPEDIRSFADAIPDPERRLEWAQTMTAKLAGADTRPTGAGPRGEKPPKLVIPEDVAAKARDLNQDPERYYKALVKLGKVKPVNPAEA